MTGKRVEPNYLHKSASSPGGALQNLRRTWGPNSTLSHREHPSGQVPISFLTEQQKGGFLKAAKRTG